MNQKLVILLFFIPFFELLCQNSIDLVKKDSSILVIDSLTNKIDSAIAFSEGTDTTKWQVTALLPDNSKYYWTAYSNDGYEESSISVVGSFLLNAEKLRHDQILSVEFLCKIRDQIKFN